MAPGADASPAALSRHAGLNSQERTGRQLPSLELTACPLCSQRQIPHRDSSPRTAFAKGSEGAGQLAACSQMQNPTTVRANRACVWQDFETNEELKFKVISFLEEVIHDPELLTQERKAAANIIR